MNDLMLSIQKIIQSYMETAKNELTPLVHEINPEAIMQTGSWANQNIAMAYISIFRTADLTEDTIDSVIQLKISELTVDFTLDVAKSSGQLIFEIWDEQVSYLNTEQLKLIVNNLCRKTTPSLIKQLRNQLPYIFSEM